MKSVDKHLSGVVGVRRGPGKENKHGMRPVPDPPRVLDRCVAIGAGADQKHFHALIAGRERMSSS